MNKRGVLIIAVFILISISYVSAVDNSTNLNKAYDCIRNKVNGDCSKLTSLQQTFAILALGNYKDCYESFLESSNQLDGNQSCWPKSGCKLKDTAIALLTLDRLRIDTTEVENWLLNQTKTASDLLWYLQIEADGAVTCSINDGSSTNSIEIGENKKVTSGAGNCLAISENGYWLKIKSDTICLNNIYEISCDKNFKTTLLYKTEDSPTIYVSQNIHSGSANEKTIERISYKCFKQGTICNYEGSLWATLVLNYRGYETSNYLPYLTAAREENSMLFPESFLYYITGDNEFLTSIFTDNFKTEYWSAGSTNKFYDTALAFLSLQGDSYPEIDSAKKYLLNGKTQNSDGCWNNVQDTGFLLYAGWPLINSPDVPTRECTDDSYCLQGEECINDFCVISEEEETNCEPNYYCVNSIFDCTDSGGQTLNSLYCPSIKTCCSVKVLKKTCSELGGEICDSNQRCEDTILDASDYGICCEEQCVEGQSPGPPSQSYTCEDNKGICKSSCGDGETEITETCDYSQSCCIEKKSIWWIWVLLGLIILIILLILFRNKLRLFFFKLKNGFKKGPSPKTFRPSFPPQGMIPMQRSRPVFRAQQRQPIVRSPLAKDSEFSDTLKKLREMGK